MRVVCMQRFFVGQRHLWCQIFSFVKIDSEASVSYFYYTITGTFNAWNKFNCLFCSKYQMPKIPPYIFICLSYACCCQMYEFNHFYCIFNDILIEQTHWIYLMKLLEVMWNVVMNINKIIINTYQLSMSNRHQHHF